MLLIIIDKKQNTSYVKKENKIKFFDITKLVLVGVVAGFINGFFGAGGGLLLVPMIHYVSKRNSKVAQDRKSVV